MDDETLAAISDLRRRVEELADELDVVQMELKEELGNLMVRDNRLE